MSSSERPPSPTPSEREKQDADARKKEEEEQATLPYKWTQKIGEVDVTIPIPSNLRAKDLIVEIKKTRIKAQIKGKEPLIEVGHQRLPTYSPVLPVGPVLPSGGAEPLADLGFRATSPTLSFSTNAHGPSKPLPRAKKSQYISTNNTNPNGGRML
jgi:CS domain